MINIKAVGFDVSDKFPLSADIATSDLVRNNFGIKLAQVYPSKVLLIRRICSLTEMVDDAWTDVRTAGGHHKLTLSICLGELNKIKHTLLKVYIYIYTLYLYIYLKFK